MISCTVRECIENAIYNIETLGRCSRKDSIGPSIANITVDQLNNLIIALEAGRGLDEEVGV